MGRTEGSCKGKTRMTLFHARLGDERPNCREERCLTRKRGLIGSDSRESTYVDQYHVARNWRTHRFVLTHTPVRASEGPTQAQTCLTPRPTNNPPRTILSSLRTELKEESLVFLVGQLQGASGVKGVFRMGERDIS